MRFKLLAGAAGLMGLAATAMPAAADTLAYDFTSTPTSNTNVQSSAGGSGYVVTVMTTSVTLTVTGLGVFDNGSLLNVDTTSNGHIDKLYIGSGTPPTSYNSFSGSALASATITGKNGATSATGTQVTYWDFAAISSLVLDPGTYWVAVVYGDANGAVNSTSAVTDASGISITGGTNCGESTSCSSDSPVIYGPDFEFTSATPLPGALPLFASGLGVVGLLMRRRKRKSALAA